ncbi:anaphase promoting complex subunit 9 NDAI_0B02570 [Naumovozyma dairenensis CBS 421]|uniref:Uncharacterized protein n=1 Tax=Naumovozyma dairenensis (strain ATCC 10597 / BCRC 20456 / CBS 421 / NBRC 0211 / NRRL Y-12639) TaxID=1071378 RepID=G0W681_NAUDC|nr:hypothetical protein NDAI_0B02570 [Naumovozyma dairenensis CBS 421]CCD23292.1 hypothetical protein NDAI_0B02570 [Naumovozyma dairenensis CBS 421]
MIEDEANNNNNNNVNNNGAFQSLSNNPSSLWGTPQRQGAIHFHNHKNDNNATDVFNTPLRRPTRSTANHLSSSEHHLVSHSDCNDGNGTRNDDIDYVMDDKDHLNSSHREEEEGYKYDYRPFIDKDLVQEHKINNLLRSEKAIHCLIFHKNGHSNESTSFFMEDSYKPDLQLHCGDEDGDEIHDQAQYPAGSLITRIPNCNANHLYGLFNCIPLLPSKRGNSSMETALRDFWDDNDDTGLLSAIDSAHRVKLGEIFKRECELFQELQLQSQSQSQSQEDGTEVDIGDAFNQEITVDEIKRQCHEIYEEDEETTIPTLM